MRRPKIIGPAATFAVLAGVAAAGVLAGGSPAQAGPLTSNAMADTGIATATAAKKPLRAERRTDIDAVACGVSIDQLGSGDSSTDVTYYNCSDTTLVLAPTATAGDGSGTITYTSACQEFGPGEAWYWTMTPDAFALRPTFIYGVAECAQS